VAKSPAWSRLICRSQRRVGHRPHPEVAAPQIAIESTDSVVAIDQRGAGHFDVAQSHVIEYAT